MNDKVDEGSHALHSGNVEAAELEDQKPTTQLDARQMENAVGYEDYLEAMHLDFTDKEVMQPRVLYSTAYLLVGTAGS